MTTIAPIYPAQNFNIPHPHFTLLARNAKMTNIRELTHRDTRCLCWKIGQVALLALLTLVTVGLTLCFAKGRKLWSDAIDNFNGRIAYEITHVDPQIQASNEALMTALNIMEMPKWLGPNVDPNQRKLEQEMRFPLLKAALNKIRNEDIDLPFVANGQPEGRLLELSMRLMDWWKEKRPEIVKMILDKGDFLSPLHILHWKLSKLISDQADRDLIKVLEVGALLNAPKSYSEGLTAVVHMLGSSQYLGRAFNPVRIQQEVALRYPKVKDALNKIPKEDVNRLFFVTGFQPQTKGINLLEAVIKNMYWWEPKQRLEMAMILLEKGIRVTSTDIERWKQVLSANDPDDQQLLKALEDACE